MDLLCCMSGRCYLSYEKPCVRLRARDLQCMCDERAMLLRICNTTGIKVEYDGYGTELPVARVPRQ